MIKIYTKDNHAKLLIKLILDAVNKNTDNSKYDFKTWTVKMRPMKNTGKLESFINHIDKDWNEKVMLFLDEKENNIIQVIACYDEHNIDIDGYTSQRPHIQGRFIGALLSNMPSEFIKIEVIPD
ncbi:hypothetical protein CLV62_10480 [Dysgonomonas alginatilytica]|uniref:Uncharacterized protein n=1 Tax=Dysgonomonas alginatilytica TaxID=1605892 RepID=A0A2V3PR59_9BACT|nr:hypothetical protein [Dysgonomonas alginatilytica]PXV66820.1 hypothetical protein CLV62_10480 [Dysgonomonas alginatilytica]